MKVPSPDAAQMIRGQVPGLAVITPDANPLSSSQLSLRGITTLGQNTTPLILIDGIPGALNSVSPDEIAQIDVLKMVRQQLFMVHVVLMELFLLLQNM